MDTRIGLGAQEPETLFEYEEKGYWGMKKDCTTSQRRRLGGNGYIQHILSRQRFGWAILMLVFFFCLRYASGKRLYISKYTYTYDNIVSFPNQTHHDIVFRFRDGSPSHLPKLCCMGSDNSAAPLRILKQDQ